MVYPIEMVYGVIEVKTTLNKRELKGAFGKCAKIRPMAKTSNGKDNKAYARQMPPEPRSSARYQGYMSGLPPRFFVFSYHGWKNGDSAGEQFQGHQQRK
jgi:hypothetical protein